MFEKKRVFISSVQKELELERATIAALISTDPFLLQHCVPVLFEKEPAPAMPAKRPYLEAMRSCAIYVLVLANEYGQLDRGLSATHREYREARKLKLPTIVFLKGAKDDGRSPEIRALIAETKKDGFTYKRFHDREDLKPELLRTLARTLAESFGIKATTAEISEGEHLIGAASAFESALLSRVPATLLDRNLVAAFNARTGLAHPPAGKRSAYRALHSRGLVVREPAPGTYRVTAAAWLLFGQRPADLFAQCEILADAYDGVRVGGRPKGQACINAPLPMALEQALKFIDDHTFHPHRVVGLNNIRLNEYPAAALREAVVNAVAHRSYDDKSRKVFIRVFQDRVEIASPGYPLQPLTLAKLRRGGYRPCSRNPLIAQSLASLSMMEQRGTGFARMRSAMLDHGLDEPTIEQQDGFFVVTLPGPAGHYARLVTPADARGPITPAIETRLNERQKRIMLEVQKSGAVSSGWCQRRLKVTRDTANRDLASLVGLGLLASVGRGRSTRYMLKIPEN